MRNGYLANRWAGGYITLLFWGSPKLSAGTTMRNGHLAHMWAKWLHDPCCLGCPQR